MVYYTLLETVQDQRWTGQKAEDHHTRSIYPVNQLPRSIKTLAISLEMDVRIFRTSLTCKKIHEYIFMKVCKNERVHRVNMENS